MKTCEHVYRGNLRFCSIFLSIRLLSIGNYIARHPELTVFLAFHPLYLYVSQKPHPQKNPRDTPKPTRNCNFWHHRITMEASKSHHQKIPLTIVIGVIIGTLIILPPGTFRPELRYIAATNHQPVRHSTQLDFPFKYFFVMENDVKIWSNHRHFYMCIGPPQHFKILYESHKTCPPKSGSKTSRVVAKREKTC